MPPCRAPRDLEARAAVQREVTALLLKGAIEEVTDLYGVLRQTLCSAESLGSMETGVGSIDFEQVPSGSEIHHGNSDLSTGGSASRGLGNMESMATLIPLGRVHKRPFQAALQARWDQSSQGWDVQIALGAWFVLTTQVWLLPWLSQGVLIVCPLPENEVFTDASLRGWGAHLAEHIASGVWDLAQSSLLINALELEAVSLALQAFLPFLKNSHVRLHADIMTVASYVNRQGGTRSLSLSDSACRILSWCDSRHILLSAVYLRGSLNVLADTLSRGDKVVHSEWTLSHQSLQRLWVQIKKPLIDLFATRFSARLPLFVSPFPDPLAWGVNALELNWSNLTAYAFPPFCLLGKVLRKVEFERPALVLVAPFWPSQHWFPDLLRLAVRPPIPLAIGKGELLQPRSGIAALTRILRF
ncbi:uncharacterized protein [Littorina saxatilis]|uniref:uncharacterized protein n=1 Tax=Littorina saxatilis TaxID=31220 RepID=UPI0038B56F0B